MPFDQIDQMKTKEAARPQSRIHKIANSKKGTTLVFKITFVSLAVSILFGLIGLAASYGKLPGQSDDAQMIKEQFEKLEGRHLPATSGTTVFSSSNRGNIIRPASNSINVTGGVVIGGKIQADAGASEQ